MNDERRARLTREIHDKAGLLKSIIARYGEGVIETVQDHVVETACNQIERIDLDQRDLDAVMEILWDNMTDLVDITVIEKTESKLNIRVSNCLFADEMRSMGLPELGFALYCAYDYGFCQGLNPSIAFSRTQTLMQGAPCCDHCYELTPYQAVESS